MGLSASRCCRALVALLHRRGLEVPVDHDLDRVRPGLWELLRQGREPLLGGEPVGQRADAREAGVHVENRHRQRQEQATSHDQAGDRAAHDALDHRRPEASFRACVLGASADERDAQRVDAVAEQAEHRREQRQRGEDRDDPDQDGPRREAPEDGVGHEHHPDHGQHERDPAEEDRPARGGARTSDGIGLLATVDALLPVARQDEERVVDSEREPHARDHVHDEERELEHLAHEGGQGDRDHDREQCQEHRDQSCDDGSEDEHEDDERRRQPDQQLPFLQVLLRELLEIGVARDAARDRDVEAAAVRILHRVDERADFLGTKEDRDDRGMAVLRDEGVVSRREVALGVGNDPRLASALEDCLRLLLELGIVDGVTVRA